MIITPEVEYILKNLRDIFSPEKIYLFGIKHTESDSGISDIDICVVTKEITSGEKEAASRRAYLEIDSDIPFDLFLYTPSEWNAFTAEPASFASRILRKGYLYYGKGD